MHAATEVELLYGRYVDSGQGTHSDASSDIPRYVPAGHIVHTEEPARDAAEPIGQTRQASAELAPASLDAVPTGHFEHTDEPGKSENSPGGHTRHDA